MPKRSPSAEKKRSLPGVQRSDAFLFDPAALVLIEDEKHPLYDERVRLPVSESLVRNIMVHGVIKPIVVRIGGDHAAEVLDGRQRVKAAREANKRLVKEGKEPIRVPAVRRRGEEADLFGVLVSANGHGQVDGPMSLARKAQRMLDLGKTSDEIDIAFGWSPSARNAHLKLLDASASVRKAVDDGSLSVTAAAKLSALPASDQKAAIEQMRTNGTKPTVHEAKRQVAAANGDTVKPSAPGKRRAKQIADSMGKLNGKNAAFADGIAWAMGALTDDEAKEAGYELGTAADVG